jgi:glutamyl-tRNA synthetase
MPREEVCQFHDHVRGDMNVPWAAEQDHIIQRENGTILYNLASVIDDYDMKITHVIRSEEHLSNTPRQIFALRGLGYPQPEYAHLPPVAEPGSKNKLSKRKIAKYLTNKGFKTVYDHGLAIANRIGLQTAADTFNPVITDFFEQVGYLPEAVVNYLILLGWSYDDKKEDFTRQEMIDLFSLERVNKDPASLDVIKLDSFQDRHMQRQPLETKLALTIPFLRRAGVPANEQAVSAIIQAAGDRIKVAGDILDFDFFFLPDEQLRCSEDDFDKRLRKPAEAAGLLRKYREVLASSAAFDTPSLEQGMNAFVQSEGIKIGQIIHAVRVAVTGKGVGFGLFETLALLGKERCLARIGLALARL